MALREEFEITGNWLFRWRSFLPLLLIAVFSIVIVNRENVTNSENITQYWTIICLYISFIGLCIRSITIAFTPKGTSGRNTNNQTADSLNKTGMYSVVRNPLYLGNFIMWLGIALLIRIWYLTVIFILIFWLYYERIIFAEEAYLRKKFGEEFLIWANSTPAFIPDIKLYKKANLPFSIKNILKREYNGFFAVILVMFFLDTFSDITQGKFEMDTFWIALLTASCIIWLCLRTLKKHSNVLNVNGR